MPTAQLVYDSRTGRILSMHHGPVDAGHALRQSQKHAKAGKRVADEHLAVIQVPSDAMQHGKTYKVDVARKALAEAPLAEGGVRMGAGPSQSS